MERTAHKQGLAEPPQSASLQFNVDLPSIPITDRGKLEYEGRLGVRLQKYRGKEARILDEGSGEGKLQEDSAKLGIKVVSLDPVYKDTSSYKAAGMDRIAGITEASPFADCSFDLILNLGGSYYYLSQNYKDPKDREEAAMQMLKQDLRVLKPGGEARIGAFSAKFQMQELMDTIASAFTKIRRDSGDSLRLLDCAGGDEFMYFVLRKSEGGIKTKLLSALHTAADNMAKTGFTGIPNYARFAR